jgi:flagellar basal body P-ring formation protein FlgA
MSELSRLLSLCLVLAMPAEVSAQEAIMMPVPTRPIFPGQNLDSAEFTSKLFNVWDSARTSYAMQQDQLIGKQAIRTLAAGKPIALRSIRETEDVTKGNPTKAVYTSGSIEIQGLLVPLTGGTVGQVVRARNAASGNIVSAMVMDGGTLLVIEK